jgi:hypothetical protein
MASVPAGRGVATHLTAVDGRTVGRELGSLRQSPPDPSGSASEPGSARDLRPRLAPRRASCRTVLRPASRSASVDTRVPSGGWGPCSGPTPARVEDGLPRRPMPAAPQPPSLMSMPVGGYAGWRTAGNEPILERRPSPRNPGRKTPTGTTPPFARGRSDSSRLRSWRSRSPSSGVRPRRAPATAARTAPAAAVAHLPPPSRPPTTRSSEPRSLRSATAGTRAPSAVLAHDHHAAPLETSARIRPGCLAELLDPALQCGDDTLGVPCTRRHFACSARVRRNRPISHCQRRPSPALWARPRGENGCFASVYRLGGQATARILIPHYAAIRDLSFRRVS